VGGLHLERRQIDRDAIKTGVEVVPGVGEQQVNERK